MNGVDKCGQYLSSYPFCRRTVKWWKKAFVRLFELSVINAMVIHFHNNPDNSKKYQAHKKFRLELIHSMVQPLLNRRSSEIVWRSNSLNAVESRLIGKHFPVSKYPQKKCCTVCGFKKNATGKKSFKKTTQYCEKCQKFICKDFFSIYHTKSAI